MELKFVKCEFPIIVSDGVKNGNQNLKPVIGYLVEGTPFDDICPLVVHRSMKDDWVVTFFENGHRISSVPQKTRVDAVLDGVKLLKRIPKWLLEKRLQSMKKTWKSAALIRGVNQ